MKSFSCIVISVVWLVSTVLSVSEPLKFTIYGNQFDGNVVEIDVLDYVNKISPNEGAFTSKLSLILPFFARGHEDSVELQLIEQTLSEKLRQASQSIVLENRVAAIWAFKYVPESRSNWDALETASLDRDLRVRSAAVSVLAILDRPDAFAILKRRLKSPDIAIRYDCCRAVLRMSARYHPEIREELLELSLGRSPYAKESKELYHLYFESSPDEAP